MHVYHIQMSYCFNQQYKTKEIFHLFSYMRTVKLVLVEICNLSFITLQRRNTNQGKMTAVKAVL